MTRLYWDKPHKRQFKSRVLEQRKNELILENTLFFPGGGGQEPDKGFLEISGEKIRVIELKKQNDKIIHILEKEIEQDLKGKMIIGQIDWNRRYSLMKAHSAQHVFSGFALKMFDIRTQSANMTPKFFLVSLEKPLKNNQLEELLISVNNFCTSSHAIRSLVIPRDNAIKKYNELLRGAMVEEDPVRLVEIDDLEITCCGGTHVKNTNEIGPIFLESCKKNRDFKFSIGNQAITKFTKLNCLANDIARDLGTNIMKIRESTSKTLNKLVSIKNNYKEISEEFLKFIAKQDVLKLDETRILVIDAPLEKKTYNKALKQLPKNLIIIMKNKKNTLFILSTSKHFPANEITKFFAKTFGGRGGGNQNNAQVKLETDLSREKILQAISNYSSQGSKLDI
ncbi:MAG: alanine--tRNA ligase-related protein [Promethearchaeota archaeon]